MGAGDSRATYAVHGRDWDAFVIVGVMSGVPGEKKNELLHVY